MVDDDSATEFSSTDKDGDTIEARETINPPGLVLVTVEEDARDGFASAYLSVEDAARLRDWLTQYLEGRGK